MGNESSLVRDCKLEREIPVQSPKTWRLYQSKRRDGSRLSVFVYETEKQNVLYIENAAKYLKVLRHPSILKFCGMQNTSDGVWLATEEVMPLENTLEQMSSSEIVAGIYSILEALVFLHDRGGLCHNNICMLSVFVSADGTWKLGAVEYLCRFDQASMTYLTKCKKSRDETSLAPEEKAGKVDSSHPGWARDAYAFGALVEILLECITDLGDMTKTFEIRIQDECLDPDPNRRPKLSTFLQDRLFKNDFLQITNFLKNVTLKSEEEKKDFFWDLVEKLYDIPVDVLGSRLVRLLLSRFILLDKTACTQLLPHLLTPYKGDKRPTYAKGDINPLLPENLFHKHVVPELFKIFHVRDVHIRSVLLQHFDRFVHQFDKDMLARIILPQILLGIRDKNDNLVRLSLQAIAQLVPILGGDIVVGTHRHKLFAQATPKFGDKQPLPSCRKSSHPESNGLIENDASPVPSKLSEHCNEASHDAERERKWEEARRRSEERRRKRLERDKNPINAKLVNSDKPLSPDEVCNGGEAHDDPYDTSTNQREDNIMALDDGVATDSDLDREIEQLDKGIRTDRHSSSYVQSVAEERHLSDRKGTSKGALKLKSSKMRTSPPPPAKVDSTLMNEMSDQELAVKGHDRGNSWGGDETETWAEGGDDDQWNSANWQDIDNNETTMKSQDVKHSAKSLSPKHLHMSTSSSVNSHSDKVSTGSNKGSISTETNSHNALQKPTKPKVANLDITTLDIKTSSAKKEAESEFDFFADMQPNIKVDTKGLWEVLNDNKGADNTPNDVQKAAEVKKPTTVSFAIKEGATVETGEGWGDDDMDWGNDEL